MRLTNWGKYPQVDVNFKSASTFSDLPKLISEDSELIARGLGRCYGDSALSKSVISMLKLNRILDFNQDSGIVTCESGISLEELLNVYVPKGWFLPVVPGTKFVTLGGAVASDIHGKNHHVEGSISNHVVSILLMLSDGSQVECSKGTNSDLFWATCGGMGLTGFILKVKLKLKKIETAYIKQETFRCSNLEEVMQAFESSQGFTYSVAWIDCIAKGKDMGRSVMIRGEHAKSSEILGGLNPLSIPEKNKINIPFDFPNFVLNPLSVKAFNFIYYNLAPNNIKKKVVDYDSFFFPLDKIHNWNRIYGKRGFTQYQFVLPKMSSKKGLQEILTKISQSNQASFLAVLKLFGKQDNLISFPLEGYTLALDFPITGKLFSFLDELDKVVNKYEGRIYLAKDVRISKEAFSHGYKGIERFKEIKHKSDSLNKFQSLQSKRIGI